MVLQLQCLLVLSATLIYQTLANSALNAGITDIEPPTKSSDMPASVVILLLLMFIALGFIGIRHIKREYLQQQSYLFSKRAGTLFTTINSRKSYGSTLSPQLNAENLDEYIDDQLYGNNNLLTRLNQYRLDLQQQFVDYMEKTPEPVLFEVTNDRSVSAYCADPQIPNNPNYQAKPFKNSENYEPNTSPALQKMFQANYEKNQSKNDAHNKVEISVRHSFNNDDFNQYDGGSDGDGGGYEAIPENNVNAYSDSDKNIHDSDNGNAENRKQNDKPVLTKKVVVLDLD